MIAGVKGQHDREQCDLNLSEETSEEIFAGGFRSTYDLLHHDRHQLYPLHGNFYFLHLEQYHFSSAFMSFFQVGFLSRKVLQHFASR